MKYSRIILLAVLALTCICRTVLAQEMPNTPRPNPPRLVNDFAHVLSTEDQARLERKLVAYDDSTSNQVVIITLKTLNGYPIEEYALKTLREWGVGNAKTNNGILIVAAIDDRHVRIETGYGLEGAIPDVTASQIIGSDIAPAFREGNYYEGFDKAAESIIKAAAGEYKAPPGYGKKDNKGPGIGGLVIAAIVIIIILSNINRRGGGGFMSRRGYRGLGSTVFWPGAFGGGGGGWSSGGGFGGGGGGFGGFGGGSGGGGGASGSW